MFNHKHCHESPFFPHQTFKGVDRSEQRSIRSSNLRGEEEEEEEDEEEREKEKRRGEKCGLEMSRGFREEGEGEGEREGEEEFEDGEVDEEERLIQDYHQSLDCEACDAIAKAALSVKMAPKHVTKRELKLWGKLFAAWPSSYLCQPLWLIFIQQVRSDNDASEEGILGHYGTIRKTF